MVGRIWWTSELKASFISSPGPILGRLGGGAGIATIKLFSRNLPFLPSEHILCKESIVTVKKFDFEILTYLYVSGIHLYYFRDDVCMYVCMCVSLCVCE